MDEVMRPTLVVGVGGTGCEAAETVYQQGAALGLIDRRLISVLGFDTDDYDHQRLRMRDNQKVRFSSASQISDLLKRNPDAEATWFYPRSELTSDILGMSLLDGAGQVRMFTRLALHDAFRHGGLENSLRQAMMQLTTVSNQAQFQGQINVVMLGSLAGGTGCGSFLQVALAIKEIANRDVQCKCDVRGIFLLPDVYVNGAGMANDQVANVCTNATAALRELNAAMQVGSGRLPLNSFQFEYKPGSTIQHGQAPFDVVTLIDYEMTNGQSLGPNLDHYKALLARAAHTQLFLPLGQEIDQRSVNSVQQKLTGVRMGTTNSYASVGVFAITYPVDAILEHLTRRFALEVLEGDWLALDRAYRRRIDIYEDRRRSGDLSVEFPDRGASFISDLEQAARDRRPLFTDIVSNIFREEQQEDGTIQTKEQHTSFLEAFENYVNVQFQNENEQIKAVYKVAYMTMSRLEEREDVADNVRRAELRLDNLLRDMEDATRQAPDNIFENLWSGGLAMGESEWQEHHLQKLLVTPAPHLVEVRYFLYLLNRDIAKKLEELSPEDFGRDVQEASAPFEDNKKPTEGRRAGQGAVNRAEEITQEGAIRGKFSGKKADFAKRYTRYYNTSIDNIRQFGETTALVRCLTRLQQETEDLLKLLELLFTDLENLQSEFTQWVGEDRVRHEYIQGAQTGNRYVYAGADAKDAIWDQVKPNIQGAKIGREANSELVAALFAETKKRRAERHDPSAVGRNFSVGSLFREQVVEGYCRRTLQSDLQSAYHMNVAEAMKREAMLRHRLTEQERVRRGDPASANEQIVSDDDQRRRIEEEFTTGLVKLVAGQAKPFIKLVDERGEEGLRGTEVVYWTMHPETQKEIGTSGFFDELFRYEQQASADVRPEYDRTSILCVDVLYNFTIKAVSKLQPGLQQATSVFDDQMGRYDAFYRRWIDDLNQSETVRGARSKLSPHLDRGWHKPGALPEIFYEIEEEATGTLYQDYVIALGMGYLARENDAGAPVTVFYDPTKMDQGGDREVLTMSQSTDRVLEAFKSRPELAAAARKGFESTLAKNRDSGEKIAAHETEIYQKMWSSQLLADLLSVAKNRGQDDPDGEAARVAKAHFEVLKRVVMELQTDIDTRRQKQLFGSMADQISGEALNLLQGELGQDTLNNIQKTPYLVAKAVEEQW